MSTIETLMTRNADFAAHRCTASSSFIPSLKTMVIACVDPRVNPAHILGLDLGEAVVIRTIGGRITPATLQTMALLRMLVQADGGTPGSGWNLVVLHHTDCGIARLEGSPELLADYLGVPRQQLDAKAVADPRAAVEIDVAALRANPFLPGEFMLSGLVYDVMTGLVEIVVPPALLRDDRHGA